METLLKQCAQGPDIRAKRKALTSKATEQFNIAQDSIQARAQT